MERARVAPGPELPAYPATGRLPPPHVGDARRTLTALRIWGRVLGLALRRSRSPFHLLRALARARARLPDAAPVMPLRLVSASGRYFWDLYAPGWPSAAFDRFVESELDRLDPRPDRPPAPQTAILAITRQCSLRCEHCCEWETLNHPDTLAIADLVEIADRFAGRGVAQLFLSGGEPLLRFDAVLAIAGRLSGRMDVWILSSGRGLTAERARRLRAAGLTGVALSLDHHEAAAHDRFRGRPGTFEGVRRAAADARAAGLVVVLSCCVSRSFATDDALERYARAARELGAGFVQVFEPRPAGRYAGADVTLGAAEQAALERFARRLNRDPAARDLPGVAYPDWFARTHGCAGGGDRYLFVDADGTLHACPFCRGPGPRVLDGDLDSSLAVLRQRGCPSRLAGGPAAGPPRAAARPSTRLAHLGNHGPARPAHLTEEMRT